MDFEERRKKFHAEYRELVMKYKIDFIALLNHTDRTIEAIIAIKDLDQKPAEGMPTDKSMLN